MKVIKLIGGLQTVRRGQSPHIEICVEPDYDSMPAARYTHTEFWSNDFDDFFAELNKNRGKFDARATQSQIERLRSAWGATL